jgi:hypothetical protein
MRGGHMLVGEARMKIQGIVLIGFGAAASLFVTVESAAYAFRHAHGGSAVGSSQVPDSILARDLARTGIRAYYRARAANLDGVLVPGDTGNRRFAPLMAVGEALNRTLDSAAALAPRDSLVAAARIWHRVTTGHYVFADSLAQAACSSSLREAWWCSAVIGFTKYNRGDYAAADFWFEAALRDMPEERRCLWTDLTYVLNDFAHTEIMKNTPCHSRKERNSVVWWLADPLWSIPGNERRTAHYSRWTEITLSAEEQQLMGYRNLIARGMNVDVEYFLRMGRLKPFIGYELGCTPRGRLDCMRFHTTATDRFMPLAAEASNPYSIGILNYSHAPRQSAFGREGAEVSAGYLAPIHAAGPLTEYHRWQYEGFGEIFFAASGKMYTIREAQTGMLLGRAGPVLLAAFDPRASALYRASDPPGYLPQPDGPARAPSFLNTLWVAPMSVSVAVSTGPHDSGRVSKPASIFIGEIARATVSLASTVDSALVSLEAYCLGDFVYNVSARHRFAVTRPDIGAQGKIRSSDVFLYTPPKSGEQPANADGVLSAMLPRTSVYSREPLGLYWEVYGLSADDEPEFELSVAPVDSAASVGLIGRILGQRANSSVVTWKARPVAADAITADGATSFNLQLDLRSLRAGVHRMTMTTRLRGDSVAAVANDVRVRR